MPKSLSCPRCGGLLPAVNQSDLKVTCPQCNATYKLRKTPNTDSPRDSKTHSTSAASSPKANGQVHSTHPIPSLPGSDFGNSSPDSFSDLPTFSDNLPVFSDNAAFATNALEPGSYPTVPSPFPMADQDTPSTYVGQAIGQPISTTNPPARKSAKLKAPETPSGGIKHLPWIIGGSVLLVGMVTLAGLFLWVFLGTNPNSQNGDAAAVKAEKQGFAVVKDPDPAWKPSTVEGDMVVKVPPPTEALSEIRYSPVEIDEQNFPAQPAIAANPKTWMPVWPEREIPVLKPVAPTQVKPLAWPVEIYATNVFGIPLDVTFSTPQSKLMILPVPTVATYGYLPVVSYEKRVDPKTKKETYVDLPDAGVNVIDVSNGEVVSRFHWRPSLQNKPALSEDGQRLVTIQPKPVNEEIETKLGFEPIPNYHCLAVFSPKKKNPDRWIDISGDLYWMGFVGPRELAVLTLADTAQLQILDVETGKAAWSHSFEKGQFMAFGNEWDRDYFYHEETKFNRILRGMGKISPSGNLLALMGAKGPVLVDLVQRQVIGQMDLIATELEPEPRRISGQMMFTSDEQYLWCLVSGVLEKRSLRDGRLLRFTKTNSTLTEIDLIESPVPGTVLFRLPWEIPIGRSERPYEQMRLVETYTGTCVASLPFAIVAKSGSQQLVTAARTMAPEFAKSAPQLETIKILEQSLEKPELMQKLLGPWGQMSIDKNYIKKRDDETFIIYNLPVDDLILKYSSDSFAERPVAVELDLKQATELTDQPQNWNPPPINPTQPIPLWDGQSKPEHQFVAWPVAFGLKECAILKYRYKHENDLSQDVTYRRRHEVDWIRTDPVTGQPIGEPIPLWTWQHNQIPKEIYRLNEAESEANLSISTQVAALRPDGQQLALCDIDEFNRVDIFDSAGKHRAAFKCGHHRIKAAFWASEDRLWLQSDTSWIVVDPQIQKVVTVRKGKYSPLHEYLPGRPWFIAWAGTHFELIDCQNGTCLNRLECAQLAGDVATLSTSPDQKKVIAGFSGRSKALLRQGPFTAAMWDLSSGEASLFPFGEEDSKRVIALHWLNDELVLAVSRFDQYNLAGQVIDLKLNELTSRLKKTHVSLLSSLKRTPDGRLWGGVYLPGLYGVRFAEAIVSGTTSQFDNELAAAKREIFEPRKWPIQVRARFKNPKESKMIAKAIAAEFANRGYTIGVGGWVLTCEGETALSIQKINATESIYMPDLELEMVLTDPEGNEHWRNDHRFAADLLKMAVRGDEISPEEEQRVLAKMARRVPRIMKNEELPKDIQDVAYNLVSAIELDRELRIGKRRLILPISTYKLDPLPITANP